ncbi:unnamed protein product [Phytophthora lilii]|uniref:Unnamed protein product n=1 Tax=Phytophthora lilii TaxID=2077276 RepID=A0A9W6UD41_9STRA|nr:unnamed protein product [Phytophthora lilii]
MFGMTSTRAPVLNDPVAFDLSRLVERIQALRGNDPAAVVVHHDALAPHPTQCQILAQTQAQAQVQVQLQAPAQSQPTAQAQAQAQVQTENQT